jgi:hypothetical protein
VTTDTRSLTDAIPPPEKVRQELAQRLREAAVLRQLLRLSERAERERQRYSRPEASHVE